MTLQAESLPQPGSSEFNDLQLEWPLLANMIRYNKPITRELYIALNWPEPPEEWTEDHEEELPPFLRQ